MGCLSSSVIYHINEVLLLATDPRFEPILIYGNDDRINSHSVGWYTITIHLDPADQFCDRSADSMTWLKAYIFNAHALSAAPSGTRPWVT